MHRIKSLLGGDKLEAELKGSNHRFELYGVFNPIITSNARLHIRLEGDRSAWERRLTIVRYERPFSGDRIFEVDKYLLSIEAPGILNWCIEGLRKLFEDYDNSGDIVLSDEQKCPKMLQSSCQPECVLGALDLLSQTERKGMRHEPVSRRPRDSGRRWTSSVGRTTSRSLSEDGPLAGVERSFLGSGA
jgi:hypothetical protein